MASCYRFGRCVLRPDLRALSRGGVAVRLGSRAYDLLLALVQRRHRVVPKAELLDLVWPDAAIAENNLEVQVCALRRVLGREAVATVPRRGYRFALPVQESDDDARIAAIPEARGIRHREALLRRSRSIERRQLLLRLRAFRLRVAASARRRGA